MPSVFHRQVPYGSLDFRDPMLFDTRLTERGQHGARQAARKALSLHPAPEVLMVSPLSRALQTAALAFQLQQHGGWDGPVVVEALARERVWLSGDLGRAPDKLEAEFGHLG